MKREFFFQHGSVLWQYRPFHRWIDTEFVMLDANFRLKSKQRNLTDPALGGGLAYYVDTASYMGHVLACGEQTEVKR